MARFTNRVDIALPDDAGPSTPLSKAFVEAMADMAATVDSALDEVPESIGSAEIRFWLGATPSGRFSLSGSRSVAHFEVTLTLERSEAPAGAGSLRSTFLDE